MRRNNMIFYYPNRPTLIPPDPDHPMEPQSTYLDNLEATGKYVAEFKWNGDNTTVYTDDISFWNREGKRLSYTPTPEVLVELKQFPKGCILNLELLHRHTKNVKNLLIVHSIMKWEDILLLGKTWGDSRRILEKLTWLPRTVGTQLSYDHHVLLAQIQKPGHTAPNTFWRMFKEAQACDEAIEGIILKDPNGRLQFSTTPLKDVNYMLKVRKPSKKYPY
jgi:hypothetical protein